MKKVKVTTIVLANVAIGIVTAVGGVVWYVNMCFQTMEANDRLSKAASNGDIRGMEAVLAEGYSVDVSNGETDETALLSAVGSVASINFLLAHGADVNHQDHYNKVTALASTDNPEIVHILLAHGADPNLHGIMSQWYPLHSWAKDGNMQIVLLLLQHGANPTTEDKEGKMPAEVAAASGHADVAKILKAAEITWKKTH